MWEENICITRNGERKVGKNGLGEECRYGWRTLEIEWEGKLSNGKEIMEETVRETVQIGKM